MRPTWLFEADVFGQTAEPLKAEIRRHGMWGHVTRQNPLAHATTLVQFLKKYLLQIVNETSR